MAAELSGFVGSHTALSCYATCPRQFYHKYVAKDAVREETPALRHGREVHDAIKEAFDRSAPHHAPESARKLVKHILAQGGFQSEWKIGATAEGAPCAFAAPGVYFRGIPDVVLVKGDEAVILDWKTGKVREDPSEIEGFACLVKAHMPFITQMSGFYVRLKSGELGAKHKLDWRKRWSTIQSDIASIRAAVGKACLPNLAEKNIWPMKPNGLCKNHCSALKCPNNGRFRPS